MQLHDDRATAKGTTGVVTALGDVDGNNVAAG